jgi:DNA-binding LytR/AlgR family response regulator
MPTALIADDEPHLLRHLEQLLASTWPELQIVARARHGVAAAEQIAALQPDVAFLDIQMPGLTGLEVAQGIEGATRIVFVTAYDQYAVQAFEQEAMDYLLKPLKPERLLQAVHRLQRAMPQPQGAGADDAALARALRRLLQQGPSSEPLRYIRAARGETTVQIPVDEVLCFHAEDKYTVVLTAQGEHLIRTPMAELLGQLDPAQFWQVHRSTIVKAAAVERTRRDELSRLFVKLHGLSREWPVSRAYVHLFKAM